MCWPPAAKRAPAGADGQDPPAPAAAADRQRALMWTWRGDAGDVLSKMEPTAPEEYRHEKSAENEAGFSPAELTTIWMWPTRSSKLPKLGGTARCPAGQNGGYDVLKASHAPPAGWVCTSWAVRTLHEHRRALQAGRGEPQGHRRVLWASPRLRGRLHLPWAITGRICRAGRVFDDVA